MKPFRHSNSTVNSGANYQVYRDALIQLKVRIDRLPWDDSTAPMKKTVAKFVDAGTLWNTYLVTRGRGSFSAAANPILSKYGYNPRNPPSLDEAYSQLIQRGLTEAKGFKLPDNEKSTKASTPVPPSQRTGQFDEICADLKTTDPAGYYQMGCGK